MVTVSSTIKCLLCQGSINLSVGNLDKFRHHLESAHDTVHDQDLVVAVSFLETEEKDRIVETVFPRIKKFFQDIKARSSQETPRQGLDKRLLEEEEASGTSNISSFYSRESKKRKLEPSSKYESLSESHHGSQDSASNRFKGSSDSSPTFSYCSTCNLSVPTSKLEEHMKNIHTNSTEDANTEEMEDSEEKVANPGEAKCDICDKVMLKKSIKKHKQRVHQLYESLKSLEAAAAEDSIAEETDTNDISIDNSLLEPQIELEENPNLATCNFCFTKMTKKNLSRHIKARHTNKEPSNETAVEEETEEDVNNVKEDHRCKICFARFDELSDLKDHFKEVHDLDYETAIEDDDVPMEEDLKKEKMEAQEFACDQCDAKYTIKDSLRRHKRNKH